MRVNLFNSPSSPVRWVFLGILAFKRKKQRHHIQIIWLKLHVLPPFSIPWEPGLLCQLAPDLQWLCLWLQQILCEDSRLVRTLSTLAVDLPCDAQLPTPVVVEYLN